MAVLLHTACADEVIEPIDLIEQSIVAHGMDSIEGKRIDFIFRDHAYRLERKDGKRHYQRFKVTNEGRILDILDSEEGFKRTISEKQVYVADSMVAKYSNSVNSVLYFMQIPLILKDPAVVSTYEGKISIEGAEYHSLKVTFEQEGGGVDFEDEFRYWINTETSEMDFLAYSYLTDGGGIRFRKAINKRKIQGVLFQDYENYKPNDKKTSLDELPSMYEDGQLELLSKIENTHITVKPLKKAAVNN